MPKTVLITGSSSGIGKATVEAFARAGWQVVATSRKPDSKLFASWPNVTTCKLDVTNEKSIAAAFKVALDKFSTIDVVVNNAGYSLDGVFEAMTDEQIMQQFETNVFGLMRVTRLAIQHMRPVKNGVIIQVASMGGRLAFPLYSAYHSTKWAVEGFSESLNYELGHLGIRVKIIEPGVINTDFYNRSHTFVAPAAGSDYDSFIKRVQHVTRRSGSNGDSPEKVAQTILRAATDNSRKLRYIVGSTAPILMALRKLLPERFYFWLVRRSYHI
jgi:NAD(P)-dependent dehydrogenase (short-subunit alcohol dehydrogenase family)